MSRLTAAQQRIVDVLRSGKSIWGPLRTRFTESDGEVMVFASGQYVQGGEIARADGRALSGLVGRGLLSWREERTAIVLDGTRRVLPRVRYFLKEGA